MSKISKFFYLFCGIIARHLRKMINIDKNSIVFGGGNGDFYSENSKYLFEYYLKHSNKECFWVTRSYEVYRELKENNKPVFLNYSPKGIYKVLKAATAIFCTSRIDIMYFYKGDQKFIINLFHGMPLKKIIYDYDGKDQKRGHFFDRLWNKYVAGFKWEDANVTLSTSQYFNPILQSAFHTDRIESTGLPRNDFFFENLNNEYSGHQKLLNGKSIIGYLPTHRKFGRGNQAKTPFLDDDMFQKKLISYDACLIHKPHYNVAKDQFYESKAIKELGPDTLDAQELLKQSSILITDYSSCYIDYMLLDRPIIFYRFDDYTKEDTGLYDKVESLTVEIGPICKTEEELKEELIAFLDGKDSYKESRNKIKKLFHQFTDGNYCERVYHLVEKL
ncbi:CDP-glycerol glycerophosphotransferase family protein [Gracilimonas tropica]|uniref:CDP-glycerol glycerophosphotransferase family protein n=1 Tax=Gracilimonas tropica TaxID=454600 RepID=UPI000A067E0D|nr:CDP-glycerol glycerophosphotransferase family protein [Gracilimonas tropica]